MLVRSSKCQFGRDLFAEQKGEDRNRQIMEEKDVIPVGKAMEDTMTGIKER